MKMLYKYPQRAFPYEDLVKTNAARTKHDPEYELLDTGIFADDRYWDVTVEYAKASPDDILIQITAANRGPDAATLEILPTLWFRNCWAWGWDNPTAQLETRAGARRFHGSRAARSGTALPALRRPARTCCLPRTRPTQSGCTARRTTRRPMSKTAFMNISWTAFEGAVNPAQTGTKACARYQVTVEGGQETTIRLRLTDQALTPDPFGRGLRAGLRRRASPRPMRFTRAIGSPELSDDARLVMRQAFAGLLWSKQFYKYDVIHWLEGDPAAPPPPAVASDGPQP